MDLKIMDKTEYKLQENTPNCFFKKNNIDLWSSNLQHKTYWSLGVMAHYGLCVESSSMINPTKYVFHASFNNPYPSVLYNSVVLVSYIETIQGNEEKISELIFALKTLESYASQMENFCESMSQGVKFLIPTYSYEKKSTSTQNKDLPMACSHIYKQIKVRDIITRFENLVR